MNRKTTFIKTLLGWSGFEVRRRGRSISQLMSQPRTATAGWTIEFIGTQGIGKTTLNNALHSQLRAHWFFRHDLAQTGRVSTSSSALEQVHRDLYFQKIANVNKNHPDTWKSLTLARQMSRVVGESLTFASNDFPRGFVLDESLIKNFPHEVLALKKADAACLWNKRAFIHLRARDPDLVVTRFQARVNKRTRDGTLHSQTSDADILARIQADNVLYDTIADTARAFDCPVLDLYAEDDIQQNVAKILTFETSIRMDT